MKFDANGEIFVVRGDSEYLTIKLNGNKFVDNTDVLELTVRKSIDADKLIYKKVVEFDNGTALFEFAPADTSSLEFGNYVYDIQWTKPAEDWCKTFIGPARFTIGEEVTY